MVTATSSGGEAITGGRLVLFDVPIIGRDDEPSN